MKKYIIAAMCLLGLAAGVGARQVKVTMKSGTVLTGEIVNFDPAKEITIKIGDLPATLQMTDVKSVESVEEPKETTPATPATPSTPVAPATPSRPIIQVQPAKEEKKEKKKKPTPAETQRIHEDEAAAIAGLGVKYGSYALTDGRELPDSFKVKVGDQELTMMLVRGGVFNMGYDKSGSEEYQSTPLHRVKLSSFYVSKEQILNSTANRYLKKARKDAEARFQGKYKDAETVVKGIAAEQGKAYRLPTEAEWEYMAMQEPLTEQVMTEDPDKSHWYRTKWRTIKVTDWCSDFLAPYRAAFSVNPKGATKGSGHVLRAYRDFDDNVKYSRTFLEGCEGSFRLVIGADEAR